MDNLIFIVRELGMPLDDYGTCEYKGRHVRLSCNGCLDIGDDNFDRWANSVDFSFDVVTDKGKRALTRFIKLGNNYG